MKRTMRGGLLRCYAIVLVSCSPLIAQNSSRDISSRIAISGGMGVNYHSAKDIVDRVNGSGVTTQRVGEFKSAVEFFVDASFPLSPEWVLKGDYAYMFTSHSVTSLVSISNADFFYAVHMPSLIVQYLLVDAPMYAIKAGVGAGYHVASYSEKYASQDKNFTASGLGTLLEIEGSNALGDDLAVYLGVQARWDFIGNLKDSAGNSPIANLTSTSLQFFGVGARLGVTYYF
jgi:hypothetical protein